MKLINLSVIVTLIFLTLKLAEAGTVANWPWLWVFSPVLAVVGFKVLRIFVYAYIYSYRKKHGIESKFKNTNEHASPLRKRLDEVMSKQAEINSRRSN